MHRGDLKGVVAHNRNVTRFKIRVTFSLRRICVFVTLIPFTSTRSVHILFLDEAFSGAQAGVRCVSKIVPPTGWKYDNKHVFCKEKCEESVDCPWRLTDRKLLLITRILVKIWGKYEEVEMSFVSQLLHDCIWMRIYLPDAYVWKYFLSHDVKSHDIADVETPRQDM